MISAVRSFFVHWLGGGGRVRSANGGVRTLLAFWIGGASRGEPIIFAGQTFDGAFESLITDGAFEGLVTDGELRVEKTE